MGVKATTVELSHGNRASAAGGGWTRPGGSRRHGGAAGKELGRGHASARKLKGPIAGAGAQVLLLTEG